MSANISLAVLEFILAAFVSGSMLGFAFRSKQMAKSKRRILELETEMVENHAEILRLNKVHANKPGSSGIVPVINLNDQGEITSKKVKTKG